MVCDDPCQMAEVLYAYDEKTSTWILVCPKSLAEASEVVILCLKPSRMSMPWYSLPAMVKQTLNNTAGYRRLQRKGWWTILQG